MTTKEMDYKLAKDIARIRIIINANNTGAQAATTTSTDTDMINTISDEIIKTMHQLDAAQETVILDQLKEQLQDPEIMAKILETMSPQYLKLIVTKLQTRAESRTGGKRTVKPFDKSDYNKGKREYLDEVVKAAKLLSAALDDNQKEVIINAAVAEAFGYDLNQTRKMIQNKLSSTKYNKDAAAQMLSFNIITFLSMANEVIEHTEKVNYYNCWTYERFQPIGIIKVAINY